MNNLLSLADEISGSKIPTQEELRALISLRVKELGKSKTEEEKACAMKKLEAARFVAEAYTLNGDTMRALS